MEWMNRGENNSGTGVPPVIDISHGLEAHATLSFALFAPLR